MERVRESGLEFPESSMLEKHLGAVNEWLNRAQAALAGSVQLRELEKLLAEAEKLAVEPGPRLPELQAKMDKALAWLEKVRKAVPKQRSTRRTMDTEVEKVHGFNVYPADAQHDVEHKSYLCYECGLNRSSLFQDLIPGQFTPFRIWALYQVPL